MAEDTKAEAAAGPWDDQTDAFISDIDATIKQKYNVSLRKMLMSPDDFSKNKNAIESLPDIKKAVNAYFDDLLKEFQDEAGQLEKDLTRVDQQYKKIDEAIASKSSIARVPYIKPLVIDYDPGKQEEIVIEQYNASIDVLVSKLINTSNYVANLGISYKGFNMGSWLFSGQREYILTINPPVSGVISIENSRDVIVSLVDAVSDRLRA